MRGQLLSILDCRTRYELAEHLGVPVSTLTFYAYGKGNRYRRFAIAKKSGGTRIIEAPAGSLLQIQKKLAKSLEDVYHSPGYVQGFVQGGSIAKNAGYHLGKRHVLNIDLSDFFPMITTRRIIGLLKSPHLRLDNQVASAIASLACSDNKLPQGAPTSPVISNMISLRLDHQLYQLAKASGATYTRYADDITFSTNAKTMPAALVEDSATGSVVLGAELLSIIKNNDFTVNPKKTRLHSDQQAKYVTGVKVNKKLNLPKRYIRQVRTMVNAYEKYGPELAQQDFVNLYKGGNRSFENVLRGKLAHIKNVNGEIDLVYAKVY
jgi:RNA-directed DNA polymerase